MPIYRTPCDRQVRPPERLVYTWAWEGPSPEPNETVVTVEFHDREGATEVVLMHEGFSSEESRGAHEHGWHAVLDNLQARVLEGAEYLSERQFDRR